ncbi:prephenate/arogenate dehydrogenase [Calothrix sp. NIES-3974]|uniref:prephenate/arogenate dehydrogenase n=1 Tax=Calothrix sp. NIES-3974 TaxID=2005462 RepID=UPI000B5FCB73|nr:prephenate/arogenate dehydrogenase [Calothrix sp. NIES-3974]BAZ07108.1 arogenate dehydrogenase [Calothrix sp. NIES-3974]
MNIGIIGLGLIGGSLGLDLRSHGHHVIGVSRRQSTCETAMTRGCVDCASTHLSSLTTVEVVFVCTPLGLIIPTVTELITFLPKTTVITDVGSVKTPIVQAITPHWQNFIGGHPMAGTAETGIDAAIPALFVNRPYVLTPTSTTPESATATIAGIIQQLKSQIYYCQPQEHDQAVSWISHLPVMVSAALISACSQERDRHILNLAQNLASTGFRDTSRVGGGNPELGRMMAEHNQEALLNSLHQYRHHLDELINLIETKNWQKLQQKLQSTQQERSHFVKEKYRRRGGIE